ncbi:LysM peptidoglycan-binding domain-containing protein [Flavobacterium litorale]|uniref:LysM peptidoglycan-binding domain-containing protein n=1 Tax=Flavobacterium litorale TaxID=2856519 RepID=A0ABX8V3F8_9FLAO|nr:LysM peptidoglycan-binding domain-containing protein [Flavobacterium litorale]QYJ67357.1 LysM peptidoglycan-binding domain-containing protein [Flavobacterium litorale]
MLNKIYSIFFLLTCTIAQAQVDTTAVVVDSISVDSIAVDSVATVPITNIITNPSAITTFFEKLQALEENKEGKINIVHIGDSHIQADILSGKIRKTLQERFGNAGCGFSFPHKLAHTNGSPYVKYRSNITWHKRRNVYPVVDTVEVGLSGIALTAKQDFAIAATVLDTSYNFNTIKIITPRNVPLFDVATHTDDTFELKSNIPKKTTYKIKSGDALSIIARKFKTTVSALKKLNGLRSNAIQAGKTLQIPTGEMEKQVINRSEFTELPLVADSLSYYYHSKKALSTIYLLPNTEAKSYNLNGLILEKDAPGILYHSIGVNGAKAVDYNKYPLFFEQLPALNPDLIIISLGTNESFEKEDVEAYMKELNLFIDNIRTKNPNACLLITTPPPSLFKRRYPNTFVAAYANSILAQQTAKNYASWDVFSELGGLYGVPNNAAAGLMSPDKVHYSVKGYEMQGTLFTEALLSAFDNFKNTSKNAME